MPWPAYKETHNVLELNLDSAQLSLPRKLPLDSGFCLQAGAQVPLLYGSRQNVPMNNFFYVNLANFLFNPRDPNYPTPANWNGKLSVVFMLQNGPAFSGAQAYITQQPVTPTAGSAQTAG